MNDSKSDEFKIEDSLIQESVNYEDYDDNDEFDEYNQDIEQEINDILLSQRGLFNQNDHEFLNNYQCLISNNYAGNKNTNNNYNYNFQQPSLLNSYLLSNMNDSITNWSMKISEKRSQSRSPITRSSLVSSTRSASSSNNHRNSSNHRTNNSNNSINHDNLREDYNNHTTASIRNKNQSTTSWGKLKHSKSSFSNSDAQSLSKNELTVKAPVAIKTISNTSTNSTTQAKNPPNENLNLFNLFQSSRLNKSYKDDSVNSSIIHHNTRRNHIDNQNELIKKTSFSQIRLRSQSSCAIAQPSQFTLINEQSSQLHAEQSRSPPPQQKRIQQPRSETLTSFSNLSNNVKKSIGVQHSPIFYNLTSSNSSNTNNNILPANEQTSIVCMIVNRKHSKKLLERVAQVAQQAHVTQVRRSKSLFNSKSSLPDLAFLNNYNTDLKSAQVNRHTEEIITANEASKFMQYNEKSQTQAIGSDLLKRKTLKSIKRYRQTKQNTEPIYTDQQFALNNSCASPCSSSQSSSSSSSPDYMTSGYSSQANTPQQQNQQYQSHYLKLQQMKKQENTQQLFKLQEQHEQEFISSSNGNLQTKQPLKSCLKRKDSSEKAFLKNRLNDSFSVQDSNQTFKSSIMFVPYVGYLFSCDNDSSIRYSYYNNLETKRKVRNFKNIIRKPVELDTGEFDNEDEEEDEEEEEAQSDTDELTANNNNNKRNVNKKQSSKLLLVKSDSDLRVKKPNIPLENLIVNMKKRILLPHTQQKIINTNSTAKYTNLSSTSTPSLVCKSANAEKTSGSKSGAPPLQYNALIAMLKSAKQKDTTTVTDNKPTAMANMSVRMSNKSNMITESDSQKRNLNNFVNSNFGLFSNPTPIIDADSISLASLSESPPSEFKFSDDEDNENTSKANDAIPKETFKRQPSLVKRSTQKSVRNSPLVKEAKNDHSHLKPQQLHQTKDANNIDKSDILNRKKLFHSILLKDTKLNNLKEILLEIKQQQQKIILSTAKQSMQQFSSSSSSSASSITNSSSTPSHEIKETIEKLANHLFEFLKQNLKQIDSTNSPQHHHQSQLHQPNQNQISFLKSSINSPLGSQRQHLLESNALSGTYAQYFQLWNLIEMTMNNNLSLEALSSTNKIFYLPKEAYLNMFQEINRYANSVNQTYLIDSGINTSQLRRKHHFMVMLMNVKFKFQLFIINLLNYHQLANWFEYLSKDKTLLNTFYDLKLTTVSGDSGMEDIVNTSTYSFNSSSSSSTNNERNGCLTSLTNISIFENEEYFEYFHKLLQQFNFIDFNLKLLKEPFEKDEKTPEQQNTRMTNKPIVPPRIITNEEKKVFQQPPQKQQHAQPKENPSINPLSIPSPQNHTGFNLKNISKRFNIKSWFTSNQQSILNKSNQINSNISTNPSNQENINMTSNHNTSFSALKNFNLKKNKKNLNKYSRNATDSLMKHSLSEPSINGLIN